MVKKTKNRLLTDALREVRQTRNRYLSLFVLSALAVAFLSGLRTTAPDMKYTADRYFDTQNMMDVRILSTLGLTDEDLTALAELDGLTGVEGARSFDAVSGDKILSVNSLPQRVNLLDLHRGRLPEKETECVTEESFLDSQGLDLGDTVTLDLIASKQEKSLTTDTFTIVGTVDSPLYMSLERGSSTLGSGRVNALLYLPDAAFTTDYYTAAYLTVEGAVELDTYSDTYEDKIDTYIDGMEAFAAERANLRQQTLVNDAQDALDSAEAEYRDASAEADQQLTDAAQKLADARAELDDGWAKLEQGKQSLVSERAKGETELQAASARLQEAIGQYHEGKEQYEAALEEANQARLKLDGQQDALDAKQTELDRQRAELDEGLAQYEAALSIYPAGSSAYQALVLQLADQKAQLDAGMEQVRAGQAQIDAGQQQIDEAGAQLQGGQAKLDETKTQLDAALAQINQGRADYNEGMETLDRSIAAAEATLAEHEQTLNEGEAEYADGLAQYETAQSDAEKELTEARAKLDDAQKEIDEIQTCEWYVLGRNTIASYVNYGSDAERMSNLADVFPIIFFLVAALACLTTMTRMVEEQRTQIGSMKALGFRRSAISVKYIGYAFSASILGGLFGAVVGCITIPWVIFNAWKIMYTLPDLNYLFQPGICLLAIGAAVVCTAGASVAACLSTLTDTPANLMRPRAPKAGKRVLLERLTPVWKRLGFIQKVTVRNLFRYKRRFCMTVIGIGGCTALIVTGFGIHNSIFDILDKQFDEISLYNASVGLKEDITEAQLTAVTDYLNENPAVDSCLASYTEMVDVTGDGTAVEGVNLFAVDDMDTFRTYIQLHHRTDGTEVDLPRSGVVITEKLSELLGVEIGDTIALDGDRRVQVPVADIAENYVYHYVYLTEDYYEALFGDHPVQNTLMLIYNDDSDAVSNQVSADLMKLDGVASYSHVAYLRDTVADSMASIDYAVIIIILSAAALAFVVLYNLTNINITERRRELATLKVLGFYDKEISAYVYRENVFLTIFGIVLGMGMGRLLHAWLVRTVEINMVMFGRTAAPSSYIWAAVLTAVFSIIVNVVAHYSLKRIDMVESLKTVE